ncbi:MAG: SBBP repeat-containing protein [Candidatus Hermodarchaeota archaeon]
MPKKLISPNLFEEDIAIRPFKQSRRLVGSFILLMTLMVLPWFANQIIMINSTVTAGEDRILFFPNSSYLEDEDVSITTLNSRLKARNIEIPFNGFIQNLGQVSNDAIHYYYSMNGISVGFGPSTITFVSKVQGETIPFSISFSGAQQVIPMGRYETNYVTNYFYDSMQLTNVPSYKEIWYIELYPGIDLRYYMSSQGLKYDFLVHPGADPSQIALQVSKSMKLSFEDHTISLQSRAQPENIRFQDTALQVFQADGTTVEARFIPKNKVSNSYGFQIEDFDTTQTLIIDPLWLPFSTYLSGDNDDYVYDLAVNTATGDTYIVGYTLSTNFPIENAYNTTSNGLKDVFVTKLNATGNGLIFSTYLGGSADDEGRGIAIDGSGNSYIIGSTNSSDFPMKNAYNSTYGGNQDVFITKLNATGNGLEFSTYLGGNVEDNGQAIAVDTAGNSYITGYTNSTNFPTQTAYQASKNSFEDVFAAKLNSSGNGLVFSTFLGGSGSDYAYGIAIDTFGYTYVTGATDSGNFPTPTGFDPSSNGGFDAFVTKLSTTGNGVVFSTYLGGGSNDYGEAIAVDTNGNSYTTGRTTSNDFPHINGYNDTYSGNMDTFITKLNAAGTGLAFSTYLGGNGIDEAWDIAIDADGNTYITGETASSNFPTNRAYNSTLSGVSDAFATKLNESGTGLDFSTYLGGSSSDTGESIGLDTNGATYIAGRTSSSNFPIVNPINNSLDQAPDIFVTKLLLDETNPSITLISPANMSTAQTGALVNLTITDDSSGVADVLYNWDGGVNTSLTAPYDVFVPTGEVEHVLRVYVNDTAGNSANITYVFTTDDTRPLIILNSPMNDSSYVPGTLIDLNITDLHTVLDVRYNWDGGANKSLLSPYDLSLISGDGLHILRVFALDRAKNWAKAIYVFTTDSMPTVALVAPKNGTVLKSGTLINLYVNDILGLSQILYNWDGGTNTTLEPPYDTLLPTGDGSHILRIYVEDIGGNKVYRKFVFIADDIIPTITLENPLNNSSPLSNTTVDLDITDENGLSVVLINWDGIINRTLPRPFIVPFPANNGTHVLYVYARDSVGNWAKAIYVFTIQPVTTPTTVTTTDFFTIEIFLLALISLVVVFWRRRRSKSE